jgi:acyl phosphate:glycerol-3-phosphate acyltransferase
MPDFSTPILYWPLMLIGAYLLGSIPFAQVVAKFHGIDLRKVGSGNVGAGNLTAQVGKGWGLLAAALDFFKGFVPVYLARKAGLGFGAAGLVGLAAVAGHNWSLFMRGRSGRGLASSAGMLLALSPALLVWTGGWAVVGYWKIGGGTAGFLGWGLLPIVSVAMRQPPTLSLLLLLLSVVVIGRRIQGNPGDLMDRRSALRRAVFDTDPHAEDFPEAIDDLLTP